MVSYTNSYKYLRILFSASGTFTPAKKQLYDKAVKALYSLKVKKYKKTSRATSALDTSVVLESVLI